MIPTSKQWKKWSLPSKLTAIGTLVGILSFGAYITEKAYSITSKTNETNLITKSNDDDRYPKYIQSFIKKYPQFKSKLNSSSCNSKTYSKLRHNKGYPFHLTHINKSSKEQFMNNVGVIYYNAKGEYIFNTYGEGFIDSGGSWGWTKEIKKNNYIVKPHTSLKIYATGVKNDGSKNWSNNWKIIAPPLTNKESDAYSFMMQYLTVYDNTPKKTSDDILTIGCAFYTVVK